MPKEQMQFQYDLGDGVELVHSGERGRITGRADYTDANHYYRVLYKAADGRQVESWWSADTLLKV